MTKRLLTAALTVVLVFLVVAYGGRFVIEHHDRRMHLWYPPLHWRA